MTEIEIIRTARALVAQHDANHPEEDADMRGVTFEHADERVTVSLFYESAGASFVVIADAPDAVHHPSLRTPPVTPDELKRLIAVTYEAVRTIARAA